MATPAPVTETATSAPQAGATSTPGGPEATETPGAPGPTATGAPAATPTQAAPPPTPKPLVITYSNFVITPSNNTIAVGQSVTFIIQKLHEPYNQTGPDQFDSGTNLVDTTYTFKFTQAGTITILCGYHANMTATLTITP